MANDVLPALFHGIITLFVPPIGVLLIAGCGADFLINICLTLLGYLPGHVHGFYLLYVYYTRRENRRGLAASEGQGQGQQGLARNEAPAPGIYSERVQSGGRGYGTI